MTLYYLTFHKEKLLNVRDKWMTTPLEGIGRTRQSWEEEQSRIQHHLNLVCQQYQGQLQEETKRHDGFYSQEHHLLYCMNAKVIMNLSLIAKFMSLRPIDLTIVIGGQVYLQFSQILR